MIEWNLQSRAHACQSCGQAFADQQVYHTLLFDERGGYTRQDLCEPCWTALPAPAEGRKGFVSHWQGVFEVPAPQPELIRKETAETLLRKLLSLNDPNYQAAVFILAVMLERKRLLKVKDQLRQEDRRVFVYEHPRTAEVFTIPDPNLSLDQLDTVQRAVAHLLTHGLPAETPAPGPESPAATAVSAECNDTTTSAPSVVSPDAAAPEAAPEPSRG